MHETKAGSELSIGGLASKLIKIRLSKIPDGETPLEIRKCWVGRIVESDGVSIEQCYGALTGKETDICPRFRVPQGKALDELKMAHPAAAHWYQERGYPKLNGYFCFKTDHVEVVS